MAKRKPKHLLSTEELISQGLFIIQEELDKIKNNQLTQLRDKSAMDLLNDYLRTLVMLKREARQESVEMDLQQLEDSEVSNLAKEALQYLKKTDTMEDNRVRK